MPKELTHWILAAQTLEQLPGDSRVRDAIASHRDIYLAGAVLPDTLLYLHDGPHAAEAHWLAHCFHNTEGNSFAPLISAVRDESGHLSAPLLACLLGVISHIEADITFHPFVYAGSGTAVISLHYRLETALDTFFLRQGVVPPVRLMKDLVTPSSREVLATTCSLLFDQGDKLPRQAVDRAISLHCRIQAMYDSTFWKLAIMMLSSLPGSRYSCRRHLFYPLHISQNGSEILNGSGNWRHPVTGELQLTTIEDLAAEAVRKTVGVFEAIEARESFADALEGIQGENLLTGLHGIGESALHPG